jgi:hypothetical protein
MATYDVLPGSMNIELKSGASFGVVVNFSGQTLTSSTATSTISSLVTGQTVATIQTVILNNENVSLSLSASGVTEIPKGSYRWDHRWYQPGGIVRPILSGIVEVK